MKQKLSGRALKIARHFPSFMRVEESEKVVTEFASALGMLLDESEGMLQKVQRAHRLVVAEEETDILKLAALLGFERADFLILSRLFEKGLLISPPADGTTAEDDYFKQYRDLYLSRLRQSVQRLTALMLDGCGSIWALLEGTAILINSQVVKEKGQPVIEHIDQEQPRGGFIHRLKIKHPAIHTEAGETSLESQEGYIYLVENPLRDNETPRRERSHMEKFRIERRGFFAAAAAVRLTGVSERTVKPMVINRSTGHGIGFRGVVPDGGILLFSADGRGYLDGLEVTNRCFSFKKSLFDDTAAFASESGHPADNDAFVKSIPPGSLERNYPRPIIEPAEAIEPLNLPLGQSMIRFSVEEAAFDASNFDEAVFALESPPAEPSAQVQIQWREHTPFAVTVLIPAALRDLEAALFEDGEELLTLLRAGLERFRAAGIVVNVEYFNEKWILGVSVLRDLDKTAGEGIDFNSATPWGNE